LTSRGNGLPGNGLLLFFRVDDFDSCVARARPPVDRFEEEPRIDSHTGTMEFALRDSDGYYVMINATCSTSIEA
jgi:hypothetical protein